MVLSAERGDVVALGWPVDTKVSQWSSSSGKVVGGGGFICFRGMRRALFFVVDGGGESGWYV